MKVANIARLTQQEIEEALLSVGVPYDGDNERVVLFECPFCNHEDKKPKAGRKFSWRIGGGYNCVYEGCEAHGGVTNLRMFEKLGVELERKKKKLTREEARAVADAARKVASESEPGGSSEEPVERGESKKHEKSAKWMSRTHHRSIALALEDGPCREELLRRHLIPETYADFPVERMIVGGWMRGDKPGIAFWYFDKKGQPIAVKYKSIERDRKGRPIYFAKFILAGLEEIPFYCEHLLDERLSEITITEGEPDTATLAFLGYRNIVSLPDGAGSMQRVREVCAPYECVNIATDNDRDGNLSAGRIRSKLASEGHVVQRLLFGEWKDVNDAVVKGGMGEEDIEECFESIRPAGDTKPDTRTKRHIPTGFQVFDDNFFGFEKGNYSHLTGSPGTGKSTLVDAFCMSMARMRRKVGYVSLEENVSVVKLRMCLATKGFRHGIIEAWEREGNTDKIRDVLSDIESAWTPYQSMISFVGIGAGVEHTSKSKEMLACIETVAKEGCEFIVVDNYSIIRDAVVGGVNARQEEYRAASETTKMVIALAEKYDCHIILLNHPNSQGRAYGNDRINQRCVLAMKMNTKKTGERWLTFDKVRKQNPKAATPYGELRIEVWIDASGGIGLRQMQSRSASRNSEEHGDGPPF